MSAATPKTIGILAFQGDVIEHEKIIVALGHTPLQVRTARDLEACDALIIPGGESTTIGKLMVTYGLIKPIQTMIAKGMPVWGTCAGAILLADEVLDHDSNTHLMCATHEHTFNVCKPYCWIGGIAITVVRNAFGRQVDSFEEPIKIEEIKNSKNPFHAVFIRAPIIQKVGKGVTILSTLSDGTIVAARQKNILVTAFHPEISGDTRMHEYFLGFR